MNQPTVSVIIPAYNCAESIGKAIDSALMQKVSLEVIVLNDCSKDNLDDVMQKYQDYDTGIYRYATAYREKDIMRKLRK